MKSLLKPTTLSIRFLLPAFVLVCSAAAILATTRIAPPSCDPGNPGFRLPAGFCAQLVADNLGSARQMAAATNGDLYLTQRRNPSGAIALRDADGDGRFEIRERFFDTSATGIAIHKGHLYLATPTSVVRFKMTPGQLKPGAPETIVSGLPGVRSHTDKGIAFDGKGGLYVNVGAPSNACQTQDRQAGVAGQDPCALLEKHGGIWKFDDSKPGQTQDQGVRYATGMRQMIALAWQSDALFVAMHGRDQLNTMWPALFNDQQNAELPAETLMRVEKDSDFGWPYCYVDPATNKLLLNPEYGGDGKKTGRCDRFTPPIASFPGHWAPNDLTFYNATQFPQKYRGGAFIAFHGSWNRAPLPQGGYNVVFVPFRDGKVSGKWEVFADGFAGKMPLARQDDAVHRPEGVTVAPDGSLYVSEGQKGRIWRIMYRS